MRTYSVGSVRAELEGYRTLSQIHAAFADAVFEELVLDFSRCAFFEGDLVAALGAIRVLLIDQLNQVGLVRFQPRVEEALTRNRFLVELGRAPRSDSYGTTVRYQRFPVGAAMDFAGYLERNLFSMPNLPRLPEGLHKVALRSLLEIFQNAEAHAHSRHGVFACGQYYPKPGIVQFTVVDLGIGFAGSLALSNHPVANDLEAIRLVVDRGITSRKRVTGGLGIRLLQQFVQQQGGRMDVVSLRGFWRYDGSQHTYDLLERPFPGTLVNLAFGVARHSVLASPRSSSGDLP